MLYQRPRFPPLEAPADDWVAYDLAVRREWCWIPDPRALPEDPVDPAVALCYGDGRVREAALHHPVPAQLLPLVVLRSADWAGPVRERAREVLDRTGAAALLAVAHVVLRLAARQRGDHAVRLLEERFADSGPQALEAVLAHPDREVRRWAYRRAADSAPLTPERFARGAGDPDIVVQGVCAEAALATVPVPPRVLDRLLGSPSARVRAIAVTALRRAGQPERAAGWLADRSAPVRACAQWAVRRAGGDPAAHYRTALADRPVPRGVIAGLGECGDGDGDGKDGATARLVLPYLDDPVPGVRAAAVGALHALGAGGPERLAPLLDDPSPAVVRRAARALAPDADRLPLDELRARLASDHPRHMRRAALRLLAERRGLEPLRCALGLLDDPDFEVVLLARSVVGRWSPPDSAALAAALPPAGRARLAAEIAAAERALGPDRVRYLRWILQLRDSREG